MDNTEDDDDSLRSGSRPPRPSRKAPHPIRTGCVAYKFSNRELTQTEFACLIETLEDVNTYIAMWPKIFQSRGVSLPKSASVVFNAIIEAMKASLVHENSCGLCKRQLERIAVDKLDCYIEQVIDFAQTRCPVAQYGRSLDYVCSCTNLQWSEYVVKTLLFDITCAHHVAPGEKPQRPRGSKTERRIRVNAVTGNHESHHVILIE
ncbi:hypothetical protein T484DRAFT_1756571 [Baffinella frigidus]|nr:hypothetical protein T484DRAFT_1756571 [Cryptophyta sp. CCMP2293]